MAKAKQINFRLIDEEEFPQPFEMLRDIRDRWHGNIEEAKIALAWQLNIKPDPDGHVLLGKCIRASDLQRELVDFDFCILLNKEVWESEEFTDEKRRALMDHELMHADRALTSDGEVKFDERGRPVWRIRGHDIEEFGAIVRRHGCWKGDLERFADELIKRKSQPLFESEEDAAFGESFANALATDPGGHMQELADRDGITMTIEHNGQKLAEFKPNDRVH